MAIFERTSQNKTVVDDTEKLICTVENAQNVDKHTEYTLLVQRGPTKDNKWHVSRRYRDFAALHGCLQQSNIELPLPPKKLIGNMHPSFIAERQIALQNYICVILKHQVLSLSSHVRSFLDPNNYPSSLAEQALQTVSIALRGDGKYDLRGPLGDIGWRIRKHYFLVNDIESKTNCLLSWQSFGPDRHLCDKDLQLAFKSLLNLSHPSVDKILAIHNLETGAYVVRKIHTAGSLRDIIYGTDYTKTHLSKYGNPKVRKPLTTGQIAHYGMQMLQALQFLHDKGLSHGHVHPGNVMINNQRALLSDIENAFLGVASVYRPWLVEHRKTCTAEAVDVHCFGRTLYEMAFAKPLEEAHCDTYPDDMPADLESVLRLCLSSTSCKHGPPSLLTLLSHPFFVQPRAFANGVQGPRPHLRLPAPLNEELTKAAAVVEARLKRDQKLVRSTRREVRIQEILGSEEELRKHKRRVKKRESVWKSTSSLADTVRSHSVSTASSPTPPNLSSEGNVNGSSNCTSAPASVPSRSPPAPLPPSDDRSALLSAICGFDKTRLARVDSN